MGRRGHDDEAEARMPRRCCRCATAADGAIRRPPAPANGKSVVGDQALLDRSSTNSKPMSGAVILARGRGAELRHPHFSSATTTSGARVRRRLTVACAGPSRWQSRSTASACSATTRRAGGLWRVSDFRSGRRTKARRAGGSRLLARISGGSPRSSVASPVRSTSRTGTRRESLPPRVRSGRAQLPSVHARFRRPPGDGDVHRGRRLRRGRVSRGGRARLDRSTT